MNWLLAKVPGFVWVLTYIAVAIFGGVFVWIVGHKGICLYDQSGIFDGAWRLLQGQVPYRDFYTPYGPVTFLIQALFFRLTGVDFSSLVLSAAVVNALAILCVVRLVRRLLPDAIYHPAAVGAALLTSVWFQAPYGTLWFEQTSFLFNLLAMVLLVETVFSSERTAAYLRIAAGCLLATAILSKQSAGVILLPVPLGVAVITCLPVWRNVGRALFQVSAGILIVAAVFVMWLWIFSSLTGFWESVVVMTRTLGSQRVGLMSDAMRTLSRPWSDAGPALVVLFTLAISRRLFVLPHGALIGWILFSYVFLQSLFGLLTLQDRGNSLGFLGVINGLAFGVLCGVFWAKKPANQAAVRYWAKVAIPLISVYYLFFVPGRGGYQTSMSRIVQQFEEGTQFTEPLRVSGASRLIWGEPTPVPPATITRKDFEDLNAWLTEADANFVVFTDSTLLYGLHKRVSPHPYLYFYQEHSFRLSNLDRVDAIVVNALQKNNVSVMIIEKVSYADDVKVLKQMSRLQAWIRDEFEKKTEFGLYEVWTMRADAASRQKQ